LICFDSRFPDEVQRVKEAGRELMEVCVRAGGTITGEHGVGLDKRELLPLVFSDADMNAMLRVRAAFDPLGLCNPGKIVPLLRGCGEAKVIAPEVPQQRGQAPLPDLFYSMPSGIEQESKIYHYSIQSGIEQESKIEQYSMQSGLEQESKIEQYSRQSRIEQESKIEQYSRQSGIEQESKIEQVRKRGLPPLSQVAQIVGDAHVIAQDGAMIVSPGSAEEISEVLKLASREGWSVLPAGGMTWLKSKADLIVSTQRLDQIIEHEPADLIAIAQAGVRLVDFNAKLAENGQWLPLDPPDDGRATIGGVVATGLGGPQQFGYGRPRNSVIGMKVVLADGSLIKAGGRVVKNVAGYDLCKLFTGSFGSLGIITEVNFKLRPRPASEATVIAPGTAEDLRTIIKARLFPVAAEIINDMLMVRFAGNQKGVAYQIEQARALLKNADVVMNDTDLWKTIAANWDKPAQQPGAAAISLMQRIKNQLDPFGTLPNI
jgi:FAD/FMN-containing dehydrogenase